MPRFVCEGADIEPLDVDSDNWMSALGEALELLGVVGEEATGIECDVLSDGDISVRTPRGAFTIHETVDTIARIRVTPAGKSPAETRLASLQFDVPTTPTNPLDAPDPTESPSYRARAESSDSVLAEIRARADAVTATGSRLVACQKALDLLMEYVPAESGAVLLLDETKANLKFVSARGPRARQLIGQPVPADKGIAGLSVRSGVSLTVREAKKDDRHYADIDARTGYRTSAILAVPVRRGRKCYGCIELLNPFAGTEFAVWHQSATQLIAAWLAEQVS